MIINNLFSNKVIFFGDSIPDNNHTLRQIVGYCSGIGTKQVEYLDQPISYFVSDNFDLDKIAVSNYLKKITIAKDVNKVIERRINEMKIISLNDFYELVRSTPSGKNYLPEDLQKSSFIILNIGTEATTHDSLNEIAICEIKNGKIVDKFYFEVTPPYEDADQYTLDNIWIEHIKKYFDEYKYVVAFNLSVHKSNLQKSLAYYGIDFPDNRFMCAMNWIKDVEKINDYTFASVTSLLNINLFQSKNKNLNKAIATAEIVLHLIENHKENLFVRFDSKSKERSSFHVKDERELEELEFIEASSLPKDYFNGKKVVITGDSETYIRDEFELIIESKGGKILTSVSGSVQIVIIGTQPGPSKIEKIKDLIKKGKKIDLILEKDLVTTL